MAHSEQTQSIEVNGSGVFNTLQRYTSRHLARPGDLYETENFNIFEGVGKARRSNGYIAQGSTLGGAIRGVYGHVKNDGTGLAIAIKGTSPYIWNGSAWSNSGATTLTGSGNCDFTSFLNRALMTDGTQTLSSADGITWDSTLFTSAPTNCLYIEHFGVRIFLANKSSIYWSSLPNSGLTDVTWNTTNFFVVPETDDGDYITGIMRLRKRLLVFKNFSTHRLLLSGDLQPDLMPIDEEIGCPTKKAAATYSGIAYFWGTTKDGESGIYMTDGETVQIISRPVSDLINAVPQSSFANIRAGLRKGIIKWYLGSVTLNGWTIPNCELRFSPRDQGWEVRNLSHSVTDYAPMKIGSSNDLYFAESTGLIMKDDSGDTFNGSVISAFLSTHYIPLADINNSATQREIYITGDNLQSISVQIKSIEKEQWKTLTNKIKRPDLFKGLLLLDSSAVRIRISTNVPGVEINRIIITKKANSSQDIYG